MGKVKAYLYDEVETQIDKICDSYKQEIITRDEAIVSLMAIENADIYVGDDIDYNIATEILDDVKGGVYA
jgi:hypothetical protein